MSRERVYRKLLLPTAIAFTLGVATLRPPAAAQAEYASSGDPNAQEPEVVNADELLRNPGKYLNKRVTAVGVYDPMPKTEYSTKRIEVDTPSGHAVVIFAENIKKNNCLRPYTVFPHKRKVTYPPDCLLLTDRRYDLRILTAPPSDPFYDPGYSNQDLEVTGFFRKNQHQKVPKLNIPGFAIDVENTVFGS